MTNQEKTERAIKIANTLKAKYGQDYFSKLGRKGGSVPRLKQTQEKNDEN